MNGSVSPSALRRIIIEQSFRAHVGHIGSALSITDIMSVLYSGILSVDTPSSVDRDIFVLSKGHAALALYAVFFLKGWISKSQLDTYCGDDTLLAVHPEHHLPGVEFSTGSLGQGLSMAVGVALGAKLKKQKKKVVVVLSDAECNSGIVWEAAMFAAHHQLSNLVVVIDLNGQQAFGYTKDVLNLTPMKERWDAFGWDAQDVDGHDHRKMASVLNSLRGSKPHVVIAHTTFGKGVSFMENKIKWHYMPLTDAELKTALHEIGSQS